MTGENLVELNEANFDKEIKKGNWVVDFWASWCVAPNTSISSSLIGSKPAFATEKMDNILSFNKGISNDFISHSSRTNKAGHCKRIVAESGRFLETTDDHLFFTERGWVEAQKLVKDDKVAILPVIDPIEFVGEGSILLDNRDFNFLEKDFKNLHRYLDELMGKGLLPLRRDDSRLLILARLAGSLFSDGSLYNGKKNNYREIGFCLGQKADVDDVIADLNSLGFSIIHISERTNENSIDGRVFTTHTFKVKCLSTSLYILFRALGIPEGNKTNQGYAVPDWIKNGELALKKEFLAGYLGGDGPRVSMRVQQRKDKNPYNSININDIEFRKRMDLVNSGVKLANEITDLMNSFGIKTSKIFYEIDPYLRKDNSHSAIAHISILNNFLNGFIISQKIGYAYCRQKQLISMYSGEFVREILRKRFIWNELHEKVMKLAEVGNTYQKVSETLKIDPLLAYQWIVKGNKPTIKKHNIKFDEWLRESTKGLPEGFLWEKIEKIENIHLPEVQVIETERDHNFIANGFLVHNCGPCKIMEPHFKEAAKELKGKVKFGKVNVEEAQELAQRFEVMSIPTILYIKDGEQVNRTVGAISKDQILDSVKETFG